MNVRYRVELTQSERHELAAFLSGGQHAARKLKRAQIEVDPIGGTTGSAFLIGSAAVSDPLSHHATRPVCCCCGCGPVGNASALSKLRPWRSVMSTALSPRATVTPSRQTAIGVRLPNAW